MNKEDAKRKIAELLSKYEHLSPSELKGYHEAKTKQGFVLPLFQYLGWDVFNTDEVAPEEKASKGRVDYAFKLHGISQLYVEAKPLKADLNRQEYKEQVITYAYNKGVTWAALTDFEGIQLYNAQTGQRFLNLTHKDYLTDFNKLWLLSRDSLQSGLLNKEAAQYGALPPTITIEKRLFSQLLKWREELSTQIHHYNPGLDSGQVDGVIQRFFNRLIFIRTCEDREIEERVLLSTVHQWKSSGHKGQLIEALKEIFREFDGYYDSDLFLLHPVDQIYVESATVEDVINGLYEIPGGLANYDFSIIDADVLGAVYEQYLGHVSTIAKERAKEAQARKGLGLIPEPSIEITAKRRRRKEHGIYYTPKFVTDYIVKGTVGRFMQEHGPDEILGVKTLDLACGSGSFLIRAYDELLNYHANKRSKPVSELDQKERLPVLKNNIFGVDLDMQAVEIARLNLLLRALARREVLPSLADNVRQGNSLISGTEEELASYFGDKWREKKPFNWKQEFEDVIANGGFDVVIGNPPWGGNIDRDLGYFHAKYPATTKEHTDSFKLFIEASLRLVRNGGFVSLIVPNILLRQRRLRDVRALLLQNQILALVDLGEDVFKGVTAPSCIFVVRKGAPANDHRVLVFDLSKLPVEQKMDALRNELEFAVGCKQQTFLDNTDLEFVSMAKKYTVPAVPVGDFDEVVCRDAGINYQRVNVGMQEKGKTDLADRLLYEGKRQREQDKMYWKGTDIDRYWIAESTSRYCRPDFNAFIRPNEVIRLNEDVYRAVPKILLRQTADHIRATIDYQGVWFGRSIITILPTCKSDYKVEYFLGLLNSRYFAWLYHRLVHETGRVFAQVKLSKIKQLPVRRIDFDNHNEKKMHDDLVALVNKMLELNKELTVLSQFQTEERQAIEKRIQHTDEQIDKLVYKLYGLNENEIKIVESQQS